VLLSTDLHRETLMPMFLGVKLCSSLCPS